MADINQLSWTPIDKNDNISELIDKINHNFSQFAMYNGGTPGADGADGVDGMVTKSRCTIHAIPYTEASDDSDSDSDYTKGVIKYFNDSREKNSEIWLDGDIAIYGPCIFKFSPTTNSYNSNEDASTGNNPFEQISFIKGEKGEKGDSKSDGYFKLSAENGESSKTLSFNDDEKVNAQSLILDNYKNIYTTSNYKDNANYAPIDWSVEADTVYSLIFPKNNTDGLVFSKITLDDKNEKKRIGDTIIKHTINQYTKDDNAVKENAAIEGVTKSSQFEILDKSTEGSYYQSLYNMTLSSIGIFVKNESSDEYKFTGKYRNEIKFNKEIEVNPGINITSQDNIKLDANNIKLDASGENGNFTINYSGLFEVKTVDETILSIKKDKDSKGNDINVIKISDINSVSSSGSLFIEGDGIININDKVILGGNNGDIALNGTIYNINTEENSLNYWGIKNTGEAKFYKIYGYYKEDYNGETYQRQEISNVFSRLDGGFEQFVKNYKGATEDEDKRAALRKQIGAISGSDVDMTVNYFTYVPVGTVIMSAKYTQEWIVDDYGGLYKLCNGGTIYHNTETEKIDGKTYTINLKKLMPVANFAKTVSYNVPDLRNRFIIGAGGDYTKNNRGGTATVTLTENNLPRHRHEYAGNEEMKKHGNKPNYSNSKSIEMNSFCTGKSIKHAGSDNGDGYIYYTDYNRNGNNSAASFNIIPPYYALTYYIKIQDGVVSNNDGGTNSDTAQTTQNQSGDQDSNVEGGEATGSSTNKTLINEDLPTIETVTESEKTDKSETFKVSTD